MATANYVLLERITVGANGTPSVTFNNIPQTGYTDLKVVMSARSTRNANGDDINILFNGSSANFTQKRIFGTGTTTLSTGGSTNQIGIINGDGDTANTFSNGEVYIPNYTSSNYKSFSADIVNENNGTAAYAQLDASLWSSTSAITSVGFAAANGNLKQYSTFSLYALSAVGTTPTTAPYAIGGDIIQTDGTYWYHAFISSGTFTPNKALSCDVLVVAGGGGAGSYGGGGGAGGVLAFASQALTANTALTATIGAGGNSGVNNPSATSGTNSQFGALTAAVGGGVGGNYNGTIYASGSNGGSGGGAPFAIVSGYGTGTSGQGNNGGSGTGGGGGTNRSGGGGGGAGGVGGNGVIGTGGTGGAGVNTVTNWGSLSTALSTLNLGVSGYIAGGGAGGNENNNNGTGGSGGGGNSNGGTGAAGVPNTGSGGGGGGGSITGGVGGSGLVIVRYAI